MLSQGWQRGTGDSHRNIFLNKRGKKGMLGQTSLMVCSILQFFPLLNEQCTLKVEYFTFKTSGGTVSAQKIIIATDGENVRELKRE